MPRLDIQWRDAGDTGGVYVHCKEGMHCLTLMDPALTQRTCGRDVQYTWIGKDPSQ